MRIILALWALPLVIFWGWFGLSYYDLNFGYAILTRELHDLVFQLYGEMLGLEPAAIPWLVAKALVIDTLILAGIWAFRRRREIAAWVRRRRSGYSPPESAPSA